MAPFNLLLRTWVTVASNKTVTIAGLDREEETNIQSICHLNKNRVREKLKRLNNVSSIVITRSSDASSGIGTTTLNDGLLTVMYMEPEFRTKEISLNKPDVLRVLGIFESDDQNDPNLPTVTLSTMSGPNQTTADFVIGEKLVGEESKAVASELFQQFLEQY